jgi:iron complex transport system permease protein
MANVATKVIPSQAPDQSLRSQYGYRLRRKYLLLLGLALGLALLSILALAWGSYDLSALKVLKALLGLETGTQAVVIWNIRLPRITAALVVGWSLGLSGLATQTLLRNPLASPSTLGISQGAAFGAAFSIVFMGAGEMKNSAFRVGVLSLFLIVSIYSVAIFAFLGSLAATMVIMALARVRKMAPESIILAGVALSSLFVSGTILVQYFATETEIASVVFWTFGDVARSSWQEIGVLALITTGVTLYYLLNRWDLNALLAGEDTALGLGVNVERLRLVGMFLAALVAALATAFHGVIAFLGLLAPHIGRRLVGPDHRMLLPFSALIGAMLLLVADTFGRVLVGSGALPVGVLTSFMGAPLFLYLLLQGQKK